MEKLTTADFIDRARVKFGDRFSYSETEYVSMSHNVTVYCHEHGNFSTIPANFLGRAIHGCPKCSFRAARKRNQHTTAQFVLKARDTHGDFYDYSKSSYINAITDVIITCPVHGDFEQRPSHHWDGKGCSGCGGVGRYTTETWVSKANEVHGDAYDYSRTVYANNRSKVIIGCPVHGDFSMIANNHISQRSGCPSCANEQRNDAARLDTDAFVGKARLMHGDKYNYAKSVYTGAHEAVIVTCPIHGDFTQSAASHANRGQGCRKCADDESAVSRSLGLSGFVERANSVHGNKYDYSQVDYNSKDAKVTIICPDHGEFTQQANSHMRGSGCPSCAIYGFDPVRQARLYYLRIEDRVFGTLYKIGITNRSVQERFDPADLYKLNILGRWRFEVGRNAFNIERRILRFFAESRYVGVNVLTSGNTELFTKDVLGLDPESGEPRHPIVEEILKEAKEIPTDLDD